MLKSHCALEFFISLLPVALFSLKSLFKTQKLGNSLVISQFLYLFFLFFFRDTLYKPWNSLSLVMLSTYTSRFWLSFAVVHDLSMHLPTCTPVWVFVSGFLIYLGIWRRIHVHFPPLQKTLKEIWSIIHKKIVSVTYNFQRIWNELVSVIFFEQFFINL